MKTMNFTNTVLLVIIAIVLIGWAAYDYHQKYEAQVAYEQMFAPSQWDPNVKSPPPDPQLPEVSPEH